MSTPNLSKAKINEIEADVLRGMTNKAIASRLGVSMGTVSNVRRGILSTELKLKQTKELERASTTRYQMAMKEIEKLKKELSLFVTLKDLARHCRPINIKPRGSGKGQATAIANASDWHFEEQVQLAAVNGVNEFNLDVAKRRSTTFFQSVASLIDMCRSKSKIDTLVLNLLGDFITGWIHDELIATNALTPPEATLGVFETLMSGIDFLLKEADLKKLIIPCVSGNHGRITLKKWNKLSGETNYDWLIYQLLARWFEGKKDNRIQFLLPQGDMTFYHVYGRHIRIAHGDNIRYNGGIGGVHIPLRKAIDSWNACIRADYNYFGHWHTDITGEDYRINGSLIGYSEFALKIKARFQPPSQAFELQHPKYGATARFPIILE
jgi:transposase